MRFPDKTRWWSPVVMAGLVVIVAATFFSVINGGFVGLDDGNNIYLNPQLGGLSWDRVTWAFTDFASARRYMPLGWLGFSAVFSWQGLAPGGYHAASLVWHLAGTVVLFAAARNILGRGRQTATPGWIAGAAALVAAAWALHPLRTETVAWASGILYTQASALAFVSLWFWTRRWTSPEKAGWYVTGAALALAASLLTYPIALGLPVICWLLDGIAGKNAAPAGQKTRGLDLYRPHWDALVLLLIAVGDLVVNLIARTEKTAQFAPTVSWADFSLLDRLLQALYVWGRYLLRLVCPIEISPIYTDLYSLHPLAMGIALTAGFAATVLLFTAWLVWRGRISPVPVLAYTAMIVPFLGLMEHPWVAHDRYSLLTHPVLLVALAFGLLRIKTVRVRLALAVVLSGGIAWGAVNAQALIGVWANPASLEARLQEQLPPNAWAGYYLGKFPASDLFLAGRFDEMWRTLDQAEARLTGWSAEPARKEFRALLRQHTEFLQKNWPGRALAPVAVLHFLHGRTAEGRGDWLTARAHFQAAVTTAPDFGEAREEEAWCELELSNPEAAVAAMEQAITLLKTAVASARERAFWQLLSAVYRSRGEPEKSLQIDERARLRLALHGG